MKQILKNTQVALGILTLSFLSAGCDSGSNFDNFNPASLDDALLQDPTDLLSADYVPNIYTGKAAVGVKNYEQLFSSMQQVTGLADMSPAAAPLSNIIGTYNNLKSGLPASNSISSYSPTQMLNVLNLATSFCQQVIGNGAARLNLLGGSNVVDVNGNILNQVPATFFGAASQRSALASFLANKFWGPSADSDSERAASEEVISSTIQNISVATGNPSMTNVVIGACATTLASGQVVLF